MSFQNTDPLSAFLTITKKNAPIRHLKSTFFVKNQQKQINTNLYIGPFFPSNFLDFSPNHHLKSALFSKIKFTLVYLPFFTQKITKNGQSWPFSSFYPILMAFLIHKIWPFWHFFPFFDPDSSRKILSKIKFTLVYRPFFPKK